MSLDIEYPSYTFPVGLALKIFTSFILNAPRSLKGDAYAVLKGVKPPIIIRGKQNIPECGPALITMNHYSRQGFFIGWAGLGIAAQLPEEQFWLMTSAWTNRTRGLDQLRTCITKVFFKRLAGMYGAITTPPMPASVDEIAERAISIRRIMRTIHANPGAILCIAPVGQDIQNGVTGFPPAGAGRFIYQIQKVLRRIIPVGVWEEEGRLIIHFGEPYLIEDKIDAGNSDRTISELVMRKLTKLLPNNLR